MVKKTVKLKLKTKVDAEFREFTYQQVLVELEFLKRIKKQKPAGVS